MTLIVEVSEELAAKLEAAAKRRGVSRDEFVRVALEEKLNPRSARPEPPFEARIIATDLPVRDRSGEYSWLARYRDEHDGRYVALDGERLVAVGDGYAEVAAVARERGAGDSLIVFVEGNDRPRFISGGLW